MADTIITNTPDSRDDGGMAGWVLSLLIIFVIAVAGMVLYKNNFFRSATAPDKTTNINVSVPDSVPKPTAPALPVPVK